MSFEHAFFYTFSGILLFGHSPFPLTLLIESVVSQEFSADIAPILAHNISNPVVPIETIFAAGLTYEMSLEMLVVVNVFFLRILRFSMPVTHVAFPLFLGSLIFLLCFEVLRKCWAPGLFTPGNAFHARLTTQVLISWSLLLVVQLRSGDLKPRLCFLANIAALRFVSVLTLRTKRLPERKVTFRRIPSAGLAECAERLGPPPGCVAC